MKSVHDDDDDIMDALDWSLLYFGGWSDSNPQNGVRDDPYTLPVRSGNIRDFAFFVFERTKYQPGSNLRSYLVLQRLCNEAALSPGIDAFWYWILV